MPIRIEVLSEPLEMVIENPTPPGAALRAAVLPDEGGVTLVKLDPDKEQYDPSGKYYEAVVQAPNWVAEGLTEFFGFETFGYVDPVIEGLPPDQVASVGFQLSNDGGTIWRVWVDGLDAWLPAVGIMAGVFNDEFTVDKRIPLFPFGDPRQLRFRIKLIPGANGLQKPVLQNLFIYNRHNMDLYEDVTRSLKRYIDANIAVPMHYMAELSAPSATIHIENDVGLDVKITEPIQVYNLGTDPGRNINLFSSLGGVDGRTITMIGSQVGQVEVTFVGIPDVFVSAEEFLNISKIPSIVIFITDMKQYLDIRTHVPETERSKARGEGRLQFTRIYYKINAVVRAQSSLKREALRMNDDLARILDQGDGFNSVANGETYAVFEQTSEVAEDRIAQGLYVGALNLLIVGKVWLKGEEASAQTVDGKIPLVTEVDAFTQGQNTCNLNLPSYLRRVYRERTRIK